MLDTLFAPFTGVGELILRLALGLVFLAHGMPKLKNPAELTGLALVFLGGGRIAIDRYLGL